MKTSFNEWLKNRVQYSTYIESIVNLPETSQEFCIHEAPHTRIKESPDESLEFLVGNFVDLGFENLGLDNTFYRAFVGQGVRIPNSLYKLRYHGLMGYTLIELADGDEPELPVNWRQGVLVLNNQDVFTWIGKKVRPDQIGLVDLAKYRDVGDGYSLIVQ